MSKKYNILHLLTGLLIVMFLGGCDGGSGSGTDTNDETAARGGCCQVSSSQCTDAPRKSQCDAVQGTYMEGLSCNGSTHECE
jgi:hypothetical protein